MTVIRILGVATLLALAADFASARDQERDFMLGARAYLFAPLSEDDEIVVNGVGTGTRLNPSVSATGEVNATYMVTDFLAVEGTAAVTRHRFHSEDGTLAGLDETVEGWLLPMTLTVQYRHDTGGKATPYIGAGANVVFPFGFTNTQQFRGAIGSSSDEADASVSVGWVAQAGLNYAVNRNFYLNLDAKMMSVAMDIDAARNPSATYDLRMTPIVVGFGIGWRF